MIFGYELKQIQYQTFLENNSANICEKAQRTVLKRIFLLFKIINNFKSELVDVFSILYFLLKLTEKYETKLYVVSKSNCFES
jgi:hypothetical protein